MKFMIAVFSATSVAEKAFCFSQSVLKNKHSISQIFFYQSGVYQAFYDPNNKHVDWRSLQVPLKVCRTAALERGLLETDLTSGYEFSTLTHFFSDLFKADRYVAFTE